MGGGCEELQDSEEVEKSDEAVEKVEEKSVTRTAADEHSPHPTLRFTLPSIHSRSLGRLLVKASTPRQSMENS